MTQIKSCVTSDSIEKALLEAQKQNLKGRTNFAELVCGEDYQLGKEPEDITQEFFKNTIVTQSKSFLY